MKTPPVTDWRTRQINKNQILPEGLEFDVCNKDSFGLFLPRSRKINQLSADFILLSLSFVI